VPADDGCLDLFAVLKKLGVMDLDRSAASAPAANWSVRTPVVVVAAPEASVGAAEAPGVSPPIVAAAGDVRGGEPHSDDATWAGAALSGAIPVKPETGPLSKAANPVAASGPKATSGAGAKGAGAPTYEAFAARAALIAYANIGDTVLISRSPADVTPGTSTGTTAGSPASAGVGAAGVADAELAAVSAKAAGKGDSLAAFQGRRAAMAAKGVRIEEVPSDDGFLDLFAVLKKLGEMEVNEVLVEAGPTLAGQLLTTFLVDELLLYIAPKLLGPQGRPLVNLPELQSLQDAWGFSLFDAKRFGDDLRLRMRPK